MVVAITDKGLKGFLKRGIVRSVAHDLTSFIQPASIDLPVGDKAYMVKQKFLPFSQRISYITEKLTMEELDLKKGATLLRGFTYLIPCLEADLPKGIFARVSPKSSIGRIDLLVRAVSDNSGLYDTLLDGAKGQVWLEVTPQSFNVRVTSGQALAQIRFFDKEMSKDSDDELLLFDEAGERITPLRVNDLQVLSLSVEPHSLVGYEAIHTNDVIDLAEIGVLDVKKFFRPITIKDRNKITLYKDRFYILTTKERVSVPPSLSVEMVPFSHLVGELRAHYAGFFDPAFGGETGATGVLEIRPHETLIAYDGQPICMMETFVNNERPNILYGEAGNSYQGQQGPKLAKYFK